MMNIKEKTAVISIILKIVFTVFKFIAYSFTGSIAILAEAWHSFTDILTSILVYLSVIKKDKVENAPENSNGISKENVPVIKIFIKTISRVLSESNVSIIIGIFLIFVSVSIFKKSTAFVYRQPLIQNPVVVGVVFIFFSFCSYIISRFETEVGKKEKSSALISDGKHSKADMLSSLLAGFSLILYKLGINVDRMVAIFIAIFIFSLAVEIIVNMIAYKIKKEKLLYSYRTFELIGILFTKKLWNKIFIFFDEKLNLNLAETKLMKNFHKYFFLVLILISAVFYSSTCFYSIGTSQSGIIERFGRCVNYGNPIKPGLHFKLPWPIDKVVKVDSMKIRQINIGNISDANAFALIWAKEHGTEEPFLSADNNLFYPYFVAHFMVNDIFKYYYKHNEPKEILDSITYRIASNIFAKKTFYQIVTTYRKQLELDIMKLVQEELDFLDSGIELISLNMKDAHPPIFIADSFEDVIAAYQDKQKIINEALAYGNSALPEARGQFEQKIKEAESFVSGKINQAKGSSERFLDQLSAYKLNEVVTRKRLYLKSIEESMKDKRKIIVDPAAGIPDVWFTFDNVMNLPNKNIKKDENNKDTMNLEDLWNRRNSYEED